MAARSRTNAVQSRPSESHRLTGSLLRPQCIHVEGGLVRQGSSGISGLAREARGRPGTRERPAVCEDASLRTTCAVSPTEMPGHAVNPCLKTKTKEEQLERSHALLRRNAARRSQFPAGPPEGWAARTTRPWKEDTPPQTRWETERACCPRKEDTHPVDGRPQDEAGRCSDGETEIACCPQQANSETGARVLKQEGDAQKGGEGGSDG